MRRAIIAVRACRGSPLVAVLFGALVLAFAACQHSDVSREVGARCDTSDECDGRCLPPGTDYPGGFCSIDCADRSQCPDNTTCADRDGGVCLFLCDNDNQCDFLGTGWRCTSADLVGGGVKVMVCRGD